MIKLQQLYFKIVKSMRTEKLLVIAGNQLRHQYFINQLNLHFPLSAVFTEHFEHPQVSFKSSSEKNAWINFFIDRQKKEEQFLSCSSSLSTQNIPKFLNIKKGRLNHDETLKIIQSYKPTKIIIFGTSLLGSKYLKLYPNRIYNLHVGLSQYYRGSSCNFWPTHDLRPDLLGATVHYVEKGIDNGSIINQDTILLEPNDTEYTLMAKTIILGTKLMIDSINNNMSLPVKREHNKNGRLCLMNQFIPKAILKVRHHVDSGILNQKINALNKIRPGN